MFPDLLKLLLRSIAIALLSAAAAWLTLAIVAFQEPFAGEFAVDTQPAIWQSMFGYALGGCFVLGLPIALLVYWLARRQLVQAPGTVLMIGALAGIMMVLASYVLGDTFLAVVFGLPSFVAAMTFAGLGYIWILKPQRDALLA